MKLFMTMMDAAESVGVSPHTWRDLVQAEHIPIMQIGRKHFIATAVVEEFKKTYKRGRKRAAPYRKPGLTF